jgi:hypothetical protein
MKQILSEEFFRMQKLAGLITESDYKEKISEADVELSNEEINDFFDTMYDSDSIFDILDDAGIDWTNEFENGNLDIQDIMDDYMDDFLNYVVKKHPEIVKQLADEWNEMSEAAGPYSTNRNMGDDIINNNADEVYQYNMFDRMDILANIQDLNTLKTKLRLLVSDWYNEGFEKEDIQEYMNFLIDEI